MQYSFTGRFPQVRLCESSRRWPRSLPNILRQAVCFCPLFCALSALVDGHQLSVEDSVRGFPRFIHVLHTTDLGCDVSLLPDPCTSLADPGALPFLSAIQRRLWSSRMDTRGLSTIAISIHQSSEWTSVSLEFSPKRKVYIIRRTYSFTHLCCLVEVGSTLRVMGPSMLLACHAQRTKIHVAESPLRRSDVGRQ